MAGTLTVTQAACHIPEYWSTKTRDATEAKVVMPPLVNTEITSSLKGGPGDILNIPYISNPTANTKTANINITLEVIGPSAAEASQTFTVSTHQHVAFAVETITDTQSLTNLAAKYGKKAGYALAAAADTNLHTLPQNFSQTQGTLGVEPTEDNWTDASLQLDNALADEDGRFIVCRPATYYTFLKSNKYLSQDLGGPAHTEGLKKARVGRFYNAPVYKTTLVRAPAAGQAENWFCHRDGVYYCSQKMYSKTQDSINQDAEIRLFSHIYGYAEALQPPVTAGGGSATDIFNVVVYGTS